MKRAAQYYAAHCDVGDIVIPIQNKVITKDHIYAELGELASGNKQGRTSPDQITVFQSAGNAVQDLALAAYLLK